MSELTTGTPALLPSDQFDNPLSANLNQLRGRKRKEHEDQLDALFCAYLAFDFWYWRSERTHLFGDTKLHPKPNPAAGQRNS
jgi:predicted RNase H-like nuclease